MSEPNPTTANDAAPTPRKIVQIQSTLRVVVGEVEGRRTVRTFPLGNEGGLLVEHSPAAYAMLYTQIEEAMDALQQQLDQRENPLEAPLQDGTVGSL